MATSLQRAPRTYQYELAAPKCRKHFDLDQVANSTRDLHADTFWQKVTPEIAERLPGRVPHDEARGVVLLDYPRRPEAAGGGHGAMIARSRPCWGRSAAGGVLL